jgi:NADPH:quinone reductase-like Zn-dependent oxidoreductase
MANQAWQIPSPGKLAIGDLGPIPKPQANQVLVRVHAASLNYRDRLVVDHNPSYPTKAKKNLIPGSDGAGIVEAVGPG